MVSLYPTCLSSKMIQLQNTEMNFIMVVDILSSIYIYNIYVYTYIYDVRLYCITQFYFGFISFFILFIYYLIILLTEEDIYIYRYIAFCPSLGGSNMSRPPMIRSIEVNQSICILEREQHSLGSQAASLALQFQAAKSYFCRFGC